MELWILADKKDGSGVEVPESFGTRPATVKRSDSDRKTEETVRPVPPGVMNLEAQMSACKTSDAVEYSIPPIIDDTLHNEDYYHEPPQEPARIPPPAVPKKQELGIQFLELTI